MSYTTPHFVHYYPKYVWYLGDRNLLVEDSCKDRCSSFCATTAKHSSLKSSNLLGEVKEWRKTIIGRESGLRRLLPRKLLLALKTFLPSFSSNTRCRQADSWVVDTELYLLGAVRAIVPRGSWEMVVHRCWKHSFGGRGRREGRRGAPNILTGTGKTCPAQQAAHQWLDQQNKQEQHNELGEKRGSWVSWTKPARTGIICPPATRRTCTWLETGKREKIGPTHLRNKHLV